MFSAVFMAAITAPVERVKCLMQVCVCSVCAMVVCVHGWSMCMGGVCAWEVCVSVSFRKVDKGGGQSNT